MTSRLIAAHPDDRSSKGRGHAGQYVAEGVRVLVVTLTGGERGDILNPAMDLAEVRDRIGDVRRRRWPRGGHPRRRAPLVASSTPGCQGDPLPPLPGCFAAIPMDEPVAGW